LGGLSPKKHPVVTGLIAHPAVVASLTTSRTFSGHRVTAKDRTSRSCSITGTNHTSIAVTRLGQLEFFRFSKLD